MPLSRPCCSEFGMPINEILALAVAAVTLFGIARGMLPFIGPDWPLIAFCGAALMIAPGVIRLEGARNTGASVGFKPYLHVGLPLTLASCALGVAIVST